MLLKKHPRSRQILILSHGLPLLQEPLGLFEWSLFLPGYVAPHFVLTSRRVANLNFLL